MKIKMTNKLPSKSGIYLHKSHPSDELELVALVKDVEDENLIWLHDYPQSSTSMPIGINSYSNKAEKWFGPLEIS